jgi:cell division septum initiation protein DivIVA
MSQNPESLVREDEGWSRAGIDAAIAGLDRATRSLSRQIDALSAGAEGHLLSDRLPLDSPGSAPDLDDVSRTEGPAGTREPGSGRGDAAGGAGPGEAQTTGIDPEAAFDAQMREAQREAEQYLERAKRRADRLVNTMVSAVEREAAEIREDAERGIRERWRTVEAEASRFLSDAKRVADNMVAERQGRISELSDGIAGRAQALTRGMEDAERVQRQFEGFVRILSETANQIAQQSSNSVEGEITRLTRGQRPRRSAGRSATAA